MYKSTLRPGVLFFYAGRTVALTQAPATQTFGSWAVQRLAVLLRPRRVPEECEGITNPGGVPGPHGQYYLFPRCVGPGNYSRIACARVVRDGAGVPVGAQRLGWALEPGADYDAYGCEDARVSYLPAWRSYVMVYTALSAAGPRLALAYSRDLGAWQRAGLVSFARERREVRAGPPNTRPGPDLSDVPNKDGALFPLPVRGPDGHQAWCLMHRPITGPGGLCMWLSYVRLRDLARTGRLRFAQHALLARPERQWEADRIGGGAVPLLTSAGWLVLYHGVAYGPTPAASAPETDAVPGKVYTAGALLLDRRDPRRILARTSEPLFGPKLLTERCGAMPNVVFPTAIEPDARALGSYYVYYGAADYRCAVLRLGPTWEDH